MGEKVRIYGETINSWNKKDKKGIEHTEQVEISYVEYDPETGEVVGTGSEDFSLKRLDKDTKAKFVYTWDGKKRNKGGYRKFDEREHIRYRKAESRLVKKYFKNKYQAELVELR